MLEVIFWQEQSRFNGGTIFERCAKVISKEEEFSEKNSEKMFFRVIGKDGEDFKISGVNLLETTEANISSNEHAVKAVETLLEKLGSKPEVIFSATPKQIVQIAKDAVGETFLLHVLQFDFQKENLYYGMCGENDTILLVAYGEQEKVAN